MAPRAPLPGSLGLGIACMIIACVGFWGSLVFYNSFLPEIAAPDDRDKVSAKGFAYGYVGSVLLQLICLVFIFSPGLVGGFENDTEASTIQFRLSFLLVGAMVVGLRAIFPARIA